VDSHDRLDGRGGQAIEAAAALQLKDDYQHLFLVNVYDLALSPPLGRQAQDLICAVRHALPLQMLLPGDLLNPRSPDRKAVLVVDENRSSGRITARRRIVGMFTL
jgi:hypothetical protein